MHEWKVGDKTQISDMQSAYYGQNGIVESLEEKGGLWVRHKDGELVYHPWGYDIVRGDYEPCCTNQGGLRGMTATTEWTAAKIHSWAVEKGWWKDPNRPFGEIMANFASELWEAAEQMLFMPHFTRIVIREGKPEGFPVEATDAAIRTLDFLGWLGLDPEEFKPLCGHMIHGSKDDFTIESRLHIVGIQYLKAWEFYRIGMDYRATWQAKPGEFDGIPIRLTAAIEELRIIAEILGYDLSDLINRKMAYNETRPYRHGGKRA